MSLFDINTALSCELPAAYQLADRLSAIEAVQNLAEKTTAADTLGKIVVGIDEDPFDGETYTLEELEARHFLAHIYAETENGHVVGIAPEAMGTPREGGEFNVYLCRQIRESEDPTDAYNFFWDRVSAIGSPLIIAAEQTLETPRNYRFTNVLRVAGPMQGARKTEGPQGKHLLALLRVTWGDVEAE